MTTQPYAYSIEGADRWGPPCFPSLLKAVTYLRETQRDPYYCSRAKVVTAHYEDGPSEAVSIDQYLIQDPVDIEETLRTYSKAVEESWQTYNTRFPTDEDKARECRSRYSGQQGWLHETSLQELVDHHIRSANWRWNDSAFIQ